MFALIFYGDEFFHAIALKSKMKIYEKQQDYYKFIIKTYEKSYADMLKLYDELNEKSSGNSDSGDSVQQDK